MSPMPTDPFTHPHGGDVFRAMRDAMRDAAERSSLTAAVGALGADEARVLVALFSLAEAHGWQEVERRLFDERAS